MDGSYRITLQKNWRYVIGYKDIDFEVNVLELENNPEFFEQLQRSFYKLYKKYREYSS